MSYIQKTSSDPDPVKFGPDPDLDLWLTEDVRNQKYENKKLLNYLEYSCNGILNIFYRSEYRALDPEFGQNRIRNTAWGVNWLRSYVFLYRGAGE